MYKFRGWRWQWRLFLPYVKHLNILTKVAVIWLILPLYFLKVCLRKTVWNDVISNKTWILPSDVSVCFISRTWERTVGFITALTYSARCTIQLEMVQNVGPPPPKKRYFKWADERIRNAQHLKSLNASWKPLVLTASGAQKTGDEVQD